MNSTVEYVLANREEFNNRCSFRLRMRDDQLGTEFGYVVLTSAAVQPVYAQPKLLLTYLAL